MKKFQKYILIMAILPFYGSIYAQNQEDVRTQASKLAQAIFYINGYYNENTDSGKLVDDAIGMMISDLDPHSVYITAKDAKAMNEPLEGNFEGIGVEFAIIRDTLTVVNPVAGGPSERAGIIAGDKIVKIDGENVAGVNLTNETVFKKLRGSKGSKVNLLVVRKGAGKPLNFDIIRDKIPINSLDACYEAAPGVVYLKLSRFAATSAEEITKALMDLKLKQINGLILDLRGNGGGLLTAAFEIGNMFLDKGQTIVYTEGRKFQRDDTHATGSGFYKQGPLAILIDENTASASEIVAGAIQDWDRGVIIGRRSFGKGLVQQMLPFSDGSQLRLTIARYHTPSGRVIQKPFEDGKRKEYDMDIVQRYKSGELFSKDSIKFPDSLKFKTLVLGRTVYGGGGIMPDIFVPADTTDFSDYFMNLIRRGIITDFLNDYTVKNRAALKSAYKSFESFNNGYKVEDKMLDNLDEIAKSKGVSKSAKDSLIPDDRLKNYIKAVVARSVFDTSAYFRVINGYKDADLEKAVKFIKEKGKLN